MGLKLEARGHTPKNGVLNATWGRGGGRWLQLTRGPGECPQPLPAGGSPELFPSLYQHFSQTREPFPGRKRSAGPFSPAPLRAGPFRPTLEKHRTAAPLEPAPGLLAAEAAGVVGAALCLHEVADADAAW